MIRRASIIIFLAPGSGSARSALTLGPPGTVGDLMETVLSTYEVHVRDRVDYWHDVACRSIVNHDSQPECRLTFNAAIQAGALADIGLVVFENSPMDISRTPGQAALA